MGAMLQRTRERVDAWLNGANPEPRTDATWSLLCGEGLPNYGPDESEAEWIAAAIEDSPALVDEARRRIAHLMDAEPERSGHPSSNGAFENLFWLASEWADPAVLGQPLRRLYDRWAGCPDGQQYGAPPAVRRSLREALMLNQADDSLHETVWRPMLLPQYSGYLPGGLEHGLGGTLRLGKPSGDWPRKEVGEALGLIARRLEEFDPERRQEFGAFLQTAEIVLADCGFTLDWEVEWVTACDAYRWPTWTLDIVCPAAVIGDDRIWVRDWAASGSALADEPRPEAVSTALSQGLRTSSKENFSKQRIEFLHRLVAGHNKVASGRSTELPPWPARQQFALRQAVLQEAELEFRAEHECPGAPEVPTRNPSDDIKRLSRKERLSPTPVNRRNTVHANDF